MREEKLFAFVVVWLMWAVCVGAASNLAPLIGFSTQGWMMKWAVIVLNVVPAIALYRLIDGWARKTRPIRPLRWILGCLVACVLWWALILPMPSFSEVLLGANPPFDWEVTFAAAYGAVLLAGSLWAFSAVQNLLDAVNAGLNRLIGGRGNW